MTLPTPSAGHDPALPANRSLTGAGARSLDGLDTMEGRIAAWCAWFGLEEPKLRRNNRPSIVLNNDLMTWLTASGASLDWVISGDVRTMAVVDRKKGVQEQRFAEVLKHFDETELTLLLDAMKAANTGVPMEEAMEA